jgi:hypothetical protein
MPGFLSETITLACCVTLPTMALLPSPTGSGVHVEMSWLPERAVQPPAGDRSPRRSGAISMVGEDVGPQSPRTRPLWRAAGDYRILE